MTIDIDIAELFARRERGLGHAEGVARHPADACMRPNLRDRPGRPLDERQQFTTSTGNQLIRTIPQLGSQRSWRWSR